MIWVVIFAFVATTIADTCTPILGTALSSLLQTRCPQNWAHLDFTPCDPDVNSTELIQSHVNLKPACGDWCIYDQYQPLSRGWFWNGTCWLEKGDQPFCNLYDEADTKRIVATNTAATLCVPPGGCIPRILNNYLSFILLRCTTITPIYFTPCNNQVDMNRLLASYANLRPSCGATCVYDMTNPLLVGWTYNGHCWDNAILGAGCFLTAVLDGLVTALLSAVAALCAPEPACYPLITTNFTATIKQSCPQVTAAYFTPCSSDVNTTLLLSSYANLKPRCSDTCVYSLEQPLWEGWIYTGGCWANAPVGSYCFAPGLENERVTAIENLNKICDAPVPKCRVKDHGQVFDFESLVATLPISVPYQSSTVYFTICQNVPTPPEAKCADGYIAYQVDDNTGFCVGLGTLESVIMTPYNSQSIRNASQRFNYSDGEFGRTVTIDMVCSRTGTFYEIWEESPNHFRINWHNIESCVPEPPPPVCMVQDADGEIFQFQSLTTAIPDPIPVDNETDLYLSICQNIDPPLGCDPGYVGYLVSSQLEADDEGFSCIGLGKVATQSKISLNAQSRNAFQLFTYTGGEQGTQLSIRLRCNASTSYDVEEAPPGTWNINWFNPLSCSQGCPADTRPFPNGKRNDCASYVTSGSCHQTCNKGYQGGAARNCTNGTLSPSLPCTLKAGFCAADAATPKAGVLIGTCNSALSTSCTQNCALGFHLATGSSFTRACHAPSFAASITICVEDSCPGDSSSRMNGTRGACSTLVAAGSNCTETCDDGFSPRTSSRSCHTGQLSTSSPCIHIGCAADLAPKQNGNRGSCNKTVLNGQYCNETCNVGYLGGGLRQCVNYTLTDSAPCNLDEAHYCAPEVVPSDNGQPGVLLGDCNTTKKTSCTQLCDVGYHQNASTSFSRACVPPHYVQTESSCIEDACNGDKTSYPNGNRSQCGLNLAVGATCTEVCNAGYTGGGVRVCRRGALSPSTPCEVRTCPSIYYYQPFTNQTYRSVDSDIVFYLPPNMKGSVQFKQVTPQVGKTKMLVVTLTSWITIVSGSVTLATSANPSRYQGPMTIRLVYNGSDHFAPCNFDMNLFFFQLPRLGDYMISNKGITKGKVVTFWCNTPLIWKNANPLNYLFPFANFKGWTSATDCTKPPFFPFTYDEQNFCRSDSTFGISKASNTRDALVPFLGVVLLNYENPFEDKAATAPNLAIIDTRNPPNGVGTGRVVDYNLIAPCNAGTKDTRTIPQPVRK